MSLTFQFLILCVHNRNTHHIKFKNITVTDATGVYEVEGSESDTPHCRVICCGGPRPKVQPSNEKHVKKEHSGHLRTLVGVKVLGPIAYPLGASRYHVPTERVKAVEDAVSADKADKAAVAEEAPREGAAFTNQAEDKRTGSTFVTINPMVPTEEKKDDSAGFRSGDRVTVTGTSRDDLNGQSGTVKDYDAIKKRFNIRLDNEKEIALRARNLKKFVHDHNLDL